ncbi:hypothetical protein MBLNU230_g1189t2 [Neophaeotheca triangularis]
MDNFSEHIGALYNPPALLPIARHKDALCYTVEKYPVTIVVGQTGSGKTTQLPQYLEAAVNIQPRQIAATSVAQRVANELGSELGGRVGYGIRFDDKTSASTKIKFLTDGLLLREVLADPRLERYSVIMVDEAHERSLSTDVLLGVLKQIRVQRPELRIIVSSATLQAEDFLKFFTGEEQPRAGAPETEVDQPTGSGRIVSVEGRAFPVDIHYLTEPCESYVDRAVKTVFDIHASEPSGDVLVFLSGRKEIDTCIQKIHDGLYNLPKQSDRLQPLPLYAGLSRDEQEYVFESAHEGTRKVICSTNIAEASVTIPDIVYVIDPGFVKLRAYNPQTGIETLTTTAISKASATQRAGRAGRTKPGKCYRLYPENVYNSLAAATIPEIQRSNLASTILQLKALGFDNIARFNFPTPPPSPLIIRALEHLYSLGALDTYAKLTMPLGTRMAELALDPQLSTTLLTAPTLSCLPEILTIAAMTSVTTPLWIDTSTSHKNSEMSRRKFAADEGDHLTMLNVYQAFATVGKKDKTWCHKHNLNYNALTSATNIRNQLYHQLQNYNITSDTPPASQTMPKEEAIRRALCAGYFAHAAKLAPDGSFRSVDGATVLHTHPSSLMFNRSTGVDWVVFGVVEDREGRNTVRDVTKVEKGWLLEFGGDHYRVRG